MLARFFAVAPLRQPRHDADASDHFRRRCPPLIILRDLAAAAFASALFREMRRCRFF